MSLALASNAFRAYAFRARALNPPRALEVDLDVDLPLNEASGNAIAVNGPTPFTDTNTVTSDAGLIYANARKFTRTNDEYFTRADDAALRFGDTDWTIEIWLNPASLPISTYLLGKYGGSTNEMWMESSSSGNVAAYFGTGFAAITNALSIGSWVCVHVWYDSAAAELGISVNAGTPVLDTTGTPATAGTSALVIGDLAGGGSGITYDGLMQSFRKWSRVLVLREREFEYNGGAGRTSEELRAYAGPPEPAIASATCGFGRLTLTAAPAAAAASALLGRLGLVAPAAAAVGSAQLGRLGLTAAHAAAVASATFGSYTLTYPDLLAPSATATATFSRLTLTASPAAAAASVQFSALAILAGRASAVATCTYGDLTLDEPDPLAAGGTILRDGYATLLREGYRTILRELP